MEEGERVVVPVTRHIVAAIVPTLHDNTLLFHLSITLHYHHLPNIILHINVVSDLMKTEGPKNATNEVFFPDNSTTTSIVLSWPFLSAAVEIPTEEARHFSIFRRYLHQRYISRNKLRLHSLLAKKTCLSKILASASSQTVKKLDLTWNNKMKVFHVIFIMKRVCLPFPPPPDLHPYAPSRTSVVCETALRVWFTKFTKNTTIRGHIRLITTKSSQTHVQ